MAIVRAGRTDTILAAVSAEIERQREFLDTEGDLVRVEFVIKLDRQGQPMGVLYRPFIERCLTGRYGKP